MPQYGGFWRRVLAYIIDSIIINMAIGLLSVVLGLGLAVPMQASGADFIQAVSGMIGGLLGLFGSWLYFALMESSGHQATVGKLALGMVVTDDAGHRIGFGRATGRYFAKIISAMILLIGFMMVGWTERKQGLHDLIAGTLVFKSRDPGAVGVDVEAFR
jgi:uncharacterized RDD family membrane protein YckC